MLYDQLEKDFIRPEMSDRWAEYMLDSEDFLTSSFKKRSMGLVCNNAEEIDAVYTAVFPSVRVMKEIIDRQVTDAMLFVHHPQVWDIRKAPDVFIQMDRGQLEEFRKNRIAIYNLHVPLDNFGEYSTSVSLADTLGVTDLRPFGYYYGALAGVWGKATVKTVSQLRQIFEQAVGHATRLYQYGEEELGDNGVAIVAGGGMETYLFEETVKTGINTFVTGISSHDDFHRSEHESARELKLNILGGTHYSTEKFACIALCRYFKKLDLTAEFIEDEPGMEDL